ncbi:MAG: glycosyltransferase family 9 protein [Sedimentisphaerales bacterium]
MDLLREKGAEAARKAQRGVILQPGAIGDCILTLPLAAFMKDVLGLGGVDILGHSEYVGILPGRTCIDGISSIDSKDLHRLFVETKAFDLKDGDPLINTFSGYAWIATFLGEPGSNFEQNLIFTANCSHSAEVITLSMKPPKGFSRHLTDFFIEHFIRQSGLPLQPRQVRPCDCSIKATNADIAQGKELLKEIGLEPGQKLVVIQPGSGGLRKCWYLDNFLSVAKELDSIGIEVIFLLGPAEVDRYSDATIKNISSVARCLRDLSLAQVLGLLSCLSGFIGNDSGITHLAAALGVRTLAVFGPTNPSVYIPIGPAVKVFSNTTAAFTKKPLASLQRELLDVLTA